MNALTEHVLVQKLRAVENRGIVMGVAIGLAVLLIAILIVVKVVLYKKHHECLHCGVDDMDDDDFMEFEDLLDDNGLALADTKDFV